jgi:hypothetical protein
MTGLIHAAGHSSAQVAVTGGAWLVAIVASALGAWLRWIAPVVILVAYLLLHPGGAHGFINVGGTTWIWIIVLVVGGFIGYQLGGRGILRNVGEREYRTRLTAAKGISSIWRRWFGDAE